MTRHQALSKLKTIDAGRLFARIDGQTPDPRAVNIFGVANRPGNQGPEAISLRNPLGASPFGLDLSHPRLGGQGPGVAGVKPALPAQPPEEPVAKMFTAVAPDPTEPLAGPIRTVGRR